MRMRIRDTVVHCYKNNVQFNEKYTILSPNVSVEKTLSSSYCLKAWPNYAIGDSQQVSNIYNFYYNSAVKSQLHQLSNTPHFSSENHSFKTCMKVL